VTLPADIRAEASRDLGVRITDVRGVGGGCISPAYRLMCSDGSSVFLKTAPAGAAEEMLICEAESLERIAATGTVRVPHVRAVTPSWLALEWLEPAAADDAAWELLGRALARMHRVTSERYGWSGANFIGPLPQSNDAADDWPSFWRIRRLEPQVRLARDQLGNATVARLRRLLDELELRIGSAAEDGPSLLHGDLWNGNVHFTAEGGALIDPSSYYGHREVDLAMAALFGGFPDAFFDAYSAEWPLSAGVTARRPVYQLYYLLVHVNLFGAGYIGRTRAALESALSVPPG
jgi:fructosamine-3-kinase